MNLILKQNKKIIQNKYFGGNNTIKIFILFYYIYDMIWYMIFNVDLILKFNYTFYTKTLKNLKDLIYWLN